MAAYNTHTAPHASWYLNEGELATLQALDDGRWRTSSEISDTIELAPIVVRCNLNELRRRRLVTAGSNFQTVGQWQITDTGRRELAARAQLTLVPEVPR